MKIRIIWIGLITNSTFRYLNFWERNINKHIVWYIIFLVRKKMMILVTISAREVVIQIRATRKTMPTKHRKIKKLAKLTTL